MATARHPKAIYFVRQHLFAGLTSFADSSGNCANQQYFRAKARIKLRFPVFFMTA
jgi:hypothetical protein